MPDVNAKPVTSQNRTLFSMTVAIFLTYLTVGIPLSVIPLFVFHELGLSNTLVGLAVGGQFLSTIFTRAYAGRQADSRGAKQTTIRGMLLCAATGLFYILAVLLPIPAMPRFSLLLLGRLILGIGESLLISGHFTWAIGITGPNNAGKIMSWNGMAIYGALAIGAPIGLAMYNRTGFVAIGLCTLLLPLASILLDWRIPKTPVSPRTSVSLFSVAKVVWLPGTALALQGCGFALISTFMSLLFTSRAWDNAGLTLTTFGVAFVGVRLIWGNLPDRIGGLRVAMVSLAVEAVGQLLIFSSMNQWMALVGAVITGCGCSLMFPSLGVEVVKRVPQEVRGTAIGGYAVFQDVAYALTGPLTGAVATSFGYSSVFGIGTLCALTGILAVFVFSRAKMPTNL